MNNHINKLSCCHIEQRNYLSCLNGVGTKIYIILPLINWVDPDQAAFTRAACSGSALFSKALKCVSMRLRVNSCPANIFVLKMSPAY